MKKVICVISLSVLAAPFSASADWMQDNAVNVHQQQQIQDRQQDRVNGFFFGSPNKNSRDPARDDSAQKLRDKAQDEEIKELRRQLEQQRADAERTERERKALDGLTDYIREQQAKEGKIPPMAIITGIWRGPYTSSIAGGQTMAMNLLQKGTSVSGTASTSGGGFVSISGSVVGDALAYIAKVTVPGCSGSFLGTGVIFGDTMTFSYKGAASPACGGAERGEGTLTKQ